MKDKWLNFGFYEASILSLSNAFFYLFFLPHDVSAYYETKFIPKNNLSSKARQAVHLQAIYLPPEACYNGSRPKAEQLQPFSQCKNNQTEMHSLRGS